MSVLAAKVQSLIYRIYDSIADVSPVDWTRLTGNEWDLAMDPRMIRVLEETLADQCRIWTVMVEDSMPAVVACACLCLFVVNGVSTAPPIVRKVTEFIRAGWAGLLKFGVLFCGLPVPAGENHIRMTPGADREAVLTAVHEAMLRLARKHHAQMMMFKEFEVSRQSELAPLERLGYLRGDVPPAHALPAHFRSFDEYRSALKARYRNQITRSVKKFTRAGFRAVHVHDSAEIERLYTDRMHELYVAVWSRAENRLEKLPAEFFRRTARAFPGRTSLTIIYRGEKVAGFTFGLSSGRVYHNMRSGIDYALNNEGDLYFNLFYNDLEQAFRRGHEEIHLGQDSDDFKTRLGSVPQALSFYLRAPNPVLQAGLQAFSRMLFPKLPAVRTHDVFKGQPVNEISSSLPIPSMSLVMPCSKNDIAEKNGTVK
jgi:predicted N-acyltransferase